jgi:hypothetical protein
LQQYGKDATRALPALNQLKQSRSEAIRNAAITAIAKIELNSARSTPPHGDK